MYTIVHLYLAVLFSNGTPDISVNRSLLFAISSHFSPEYLAEYIPGLPHKASTSIPESSAIAGKFDNKDAFLAFNIEFSTNVRPVSGISGMFKSD